MHTIQIANYELSSQIIFDDLKHFLLDEMEQIVFEFNERQYLGHSDWRIPSRDDWENLISCKKKFQKEFKNDENWYWSSSLYVYLNKYACVTLFPNSISSTDILANEKFAVRLIRDKN